MSSVRLTQEIRLHLRKALMARAFPREVHDIAKELRAAFAVQLYNTIYGPRQQTQMKKAPAGWLRASAEVGIKLGGCWLEASFPDKVKRHFTADFPRELPVDHPLTREYEKLERQIGKLHEERSAEQARIKAVLNSYTTVGGLLKAWPELEPLLPPAGASTVIKALPMIPVAELNERFKLPVSTKKKAA